MGDEGPENCIDADEGSGDEGGSVSSIGQKGCSGTDEEGSADRGRTRSVKSELVERVRKHDGVGDKAFWVCDGQEWSGDDSESG